ncbi:hypothetical protein [Cellulosimicrobium sp. E-16]|uniref:hypothetical protein n=1 Tax=Cellulosimicrobium sp. E-16 TaxID=3404049 RepID=UPI003CEB6EAE
MHPPLAEADLTAWGRRPSRRVLSATSTVVLVATWTAYVALSIVLSADPDVLSAEEAADPEYWSTGLLAGVAVGALLLVWVCPRVGVWAGAVVTAVAAVGTPLPAAATALGGAAVLALLALSQSRARARQREASATWGGSTAPVVPDGLPEARAYAARWRGVRTAAAVACLVAAVVCGAWFARDLAAARAFRSGALEAPGTVVEQDGLDAVVEVDGLRFDVPLELASVEVGDVVGVRYDGSGRAELVDDVADPSLLLVPAGAGALTGTALLAHEAVRRRRVRRLLLHGGPATTAYATWHEHGALILPSAHAAPIAVARDLLLLSEPPEEAWHDDDPLDRDVSELSDDELVTRARADEGTGDESGDEPSWEGSPPTWQGTRLLVVGLRADGWPVAVRGPDDRWYVTDTDVAAPPRARRHLPPSDRVRSTDDGADDRDATRDARRGQGSRPGRWAGLARSTGAAGPTATLPAVLAFALWVAPEVSWFVALTGSVTLAGALHTWSSAARPALSTTTDALVVHGPLRDTFVPWSRVTSVRARQGALVVRLAPSMLDAEEALVISDCPLGGFLRGVDDPLVARDTVLSARAVSTPASTESRRRPSRDAVVAALGALAFVAGVVLGA